jgi:hypothetical protein
MKLTEGKQLEYLKWIMFALILFIIYKVVNKFGLFDKSTTEIETEQSTVETSPDIVKDTIKTIQTKNPRLKATLTSQQYISIANNLYNALKGWTEDESLVYREFLKLNNDIDMVVLTGVYGTREIPNDVWLKPNFTGNLSQTINHFLNITEITLLNNMLAKKGITNRF